MSIQPTIYTADHHLIDPTAIDADALYVIQRLTEAGFVAYLVGGGVRDLLFHRRPKDFDISTSARPEEIRRLFRNCLLIGRRFRLAHVRFGRKVIEVSTFRAGDPETDALITHDNEWGTPEQDVLRRDFTINGLYYDPRDHAVIDYVGGFADIERRRLMTIGVPEVRFRQDPVRMIRLLKFRARFDLEIEPATERALWQCSPEIRKSSPARVLEELLRMLESGAAAPFFQLMVDTNLLQQLLPGLSRALCAEYEGHEMMLILQAVDLLQQSSRTPLPRAALVAALFWPLMRDLVEAHWKADGAVPHLGELLSLANHLVSEMLESFTHFPKRLRWLVTQTLLHQFRFTPLEPGRIPRLRMPSEEKMLALEVLRIRSVLDPALLPIYEQLRGERRGHAR